MVSVAPVRGSLGTSGMAGATVSTVKVCHFPAGASPSTSGANCPLQRLNHYPIIDMIMTEKQLVTTE